MSSAAEALQLAGILEPLDPRDLPTLTERLRTLIATLNGADPLEVQVARTEATRLFVAAEVPDARRLVDAAFAVRSAEKERRDQLQQGQVVALADPESWPEPISGAELLSDLVKTFATYVALPDGGATVLALWTLHAHAHAAAAVSPLLALTSPERRCGKSTTLHLLSALVPRPLPASSISPAALFRAVERYRPALLLDEADSVLRENEDLRCILNASHARAGAVVIRTVGEDFEPRTFSTWCPKAIAMIGEPPGTLADRAIVLGMRRRRPDEAVAKLRLDRLQQLEPLRRQAWRWAQDHRADLENADPTVPEELHDRAADNWRPLLAIADICSGAWPERARGAARLLSGVTGEDLGAPTAQLLADVRDLFVERGVDRLASSEIIDALVQREDRPWPEWHGKPLSKRGLARLLGRFGISPTQLRIGGDKTRGYERAAFADVWARYLPVQVVQAVQPNNGAENRAICDPVLFEPVPDGESEENLHGGLIVPDVPDAGGAWKQEGDAWEPGDPGGEP
jgi:putative DNA primase/helicase